MPKQLDQLMDAVRRARQFAFHDIWQIGAPGEKIPRGIIAKQIRVAILLVSKLIDGMHMVRAAALTFATLLSIVPLLALVFFAIQRLDLGDQVYGFVERRLELAAERVAPKRSIGTVAEELAEEASAPPPAAQEAAPPGAAPDAQPSTSPPPTSAAPEPDETDSTRLQRDIVSALFQGVTHRREDMRDPVDGITTTAETIAKLANDAATNPTALTVSGIVLVLTTVFGLMRNVENVFNHIWGVRRRRAWYRTFVDYFVIVVLLPFVLAAVMGVLAALQSDPVTRFVGGSLILQRLGQFSVGVAVLTVLYRFVPHTSVRFKYALLAGITAGLMWAALSWAYVEFQFGLARYAMILSAFAQVPMLLMWIYLSWAIVLLGCEIAYAYQHERTFALERYADDASYAYREAVGVRAMVDIGHRFSEGRASFTAEAISQEWNVPLRLLNEVLDGLVQADLLTVSAGETPEYQPARPLEKISAAEILKALRNDGTEPSRFMRDERFRKMFDELNRTDRGFAGATLADLVEGYARAILRPEPEALSATTSHA